MPHGRIGLKVTAESEPRTNYDQPIAILLNAWVQDTLPIPALIEPKISIDWPLKF